MSKLINKLTLPALLLLSSPALILAGCNGKDTVRVADDAIPEQPQISQPSEAQTIPGIAEDMLVAATPAMESAADTGTSITMTEAEPAMDTPVEATQKTDNTTAEIADTTAAPEETQPPQSQLISFGFDKSDIDAQYDAMLQQHAQYLIDHPQMFLEVKGHTDSTGPKAYNQYLSKKRADAVAKRLVEYGAPVTQIRIEGSADDEPLLGATTKREQRRVELFYQDSHLVSN